MARLSLSAFAFVVLCGVALTAAAATTMAEQCAALAKQYDLASKDKVAPDKLRKSQTHRAHGADLCGQGKPAAGVNALKAALKEIGVKPAV